MLANRVERGRYLDSVALMRISRRVGALAGVEAAALMIGTPSNKALLREAGLLSVDGERAEPNDLIIAVRAPNAAAAMDAAAAMLAEKPAQPAAGLRTTSSLRRALELEPQANLALISVPGAFAAQEARSALERGLNVMMFSDNVSIEDEVALKRLAKDRRLLLMGPDCGTALISGAPLAFANVVPRGEIGIASASGTGLQEVSCLIARLGGGVSHGIGVGGRDLDERVGALGMLSALDLLDADPATKTLVLISKPPSPRVAETVLARVRQSRKRSVVCFLGIEKPNLAPTLRAAAEMATGKKLSEENIDKRVKGRVEALYCGGTLCSEAELIFRRLGLTGHRFIDLGDDQYTRGRPHPMIDPEIRNDRLATALADPLVGVILVDIVLGYGAHRDPAGVLARENLAQKTVIASVVGTEADPQVRSRQVAALAAAGVIVAPSNAKAAALAAELTRG